MLTGPYSDALDRALANVEKLNICAIVEGIHAYTCREVDELVIIAGLGSNHHVQGNTTYDGLMAHIALDVVPIV